MDPIGTDMNTSSLLIGAWYVYIVKEAKTDCNLFKKKTKF